MNRTAKRLLTLHRDESGLTTLEVVAILAVAAIALTAAKRAWLDLIKPWFRKSVNTVVNWQGDAA